MSADIFYHGAKVSISEGARLGPRRPSPEPEERAVEEILERFRPANCNRRTESVYLSDAADPDNIERGGGYADFIFRVEPEGRVERNDASWWGHIFSGGALEYAAGDKGVLPSLKPMADAYWAGLPSERPRWEYRAPAARVIERVNGHSNSSGMRR